VKAIQTWWAAWRNSRNGGAPIGACSALMTAAFSSGKPGVFDGVMTVVRWSGNATVNWPRPYASFTFIDEIKALGRKRAKEILEQRSGELTGCTWLARKMRISSGSLISIAALAR